MEQRKDFFIPPEQLNCSNNNPSIFICTNENCKLSAFICKDKSCACIRDKHAKCHLQRTQSIIKSMEQQRRQITQENQSAFDAVIKIYEDMIQKISKEKENFIDYVEMFGLQENMRKFVTLIKQGKRSQVVGDLVHKVHLEIKKQATKVARFQVDEQRVKELWEKKSKELNYILVDWRDLIQIRVNDSKIIDLALSKSYLIQIIPITYKQSFADQ